MSKPNWNSLKEKSARNWRVIAALFVSIYTAMTLAFDATGSQLRLLSPAWLELIFFSVFVLLVFMEISSLRKTIDKMKSLRPILAPLEWFVDNRPVMQTNTLLGQPSFAHVIITNVSKYHGKGSTANKVIAKIGAYSLEGELLVGPIIGRWGDTPQPTVRSFSSKTVEERDSVTKAFISKTRGSPEIEISSNGLPRELNIALKWPENNDCYLFNDSSYGFIKFENPKLKLGNDKYKIHITLSGENVDDIELWFLLINEGQHKGISIDRSSSSVALNSFSSKH